MTPSALEQTKPSHRAADKKTASDVDLAVDINHPYRPSGQQSDLSCCGRLPALLTAFLFRCLIRTKRKKVVERSSPSPASISQTPERQLHEALLQLRSPAMSVDAMEIDSPAARASASPERERKRKHKHKDHHTPSKKRKHDNDDNAAAVVDSSLIATEASQEKTKNKKEKSKDKKDKKEHKTAQIQEAGDADSPFKLITATLYLPLSPISISQTHALASLLAEHLSPLLLTYYPPFKGVILAYDNASISSTPPTPASVASSSSKDKDTENPKPLTLAMTANEYGVLYVYLTATFLVFRPQRGQTLEGWVNVQSEGFLGAVVYNLFSVGVERRRLPADWKWIPPGEEEKDNNNNNNNNGDNQTGKSPKKKSTTSTVSDADFDPEKEHFTPLDLSNNSDPLVEDPDTEDSMQGHFESVSGHRVRGTIRFRVREVDTIPGAERDRSFLSIEGTMLSPEEEARLVQEERSGVPSSASYSSSSSLSSSSSSSSRRWGDSSSAMSGALAGSSSAAAAVATASSPNQSSSSAQQPAAETKDESGSKSKKEKKEKEKEKAKEKAKDKDKDKSSKSKSKKDKEEK